MILSVTLPVGSSFSDTAAECAIGGTCLIGLTDANNAAVGASTSFSFGTPIMAPLKSHTDVLPNSVAAIKVAGFPIGDTIVAQECDPNLVIPATVASDCDAATQVSATASAKGTVAFTPGLTWAVGGAFSDTANGTCPAGGTCEVLVSDSTNPSVGLDQAVSFAVPTASVKLSANVTANYVDKVTAAEFPGGDTVTAQECESSVTSANLATHCDNATTLTGTVAANGKVTFTGAGVTVLVGTYSDSNSGTLHAGGSADIVVTDSTHSGFYVAIPITLHS